MFRIHLRVSGKVQGVGFRHYTSQKANEFSLVGWVRNCVDGTVEVVAEGPAKAIRLFDEWCGEGPKGAVVNQKEVIERVAIAELTFARFEIRDGG